jgi:energy-converting hydrogenase Eha subunit E
VPPGLADRSGHAPPRIAQLVLGGQAVYYVVTGCWPIVHMGSFEAITGPKVDDWLVKMVGLLAATIGITLGVAVRRRRWSAEVRTLAILSALSFAAIDLRYAVTGRISPIYLADAAAELAIAGLLGGAALLAPRRSA